MSADDAIARLEEILGYRFRDRELALQALTHASWINEHDAPGHNERLEFLGDAVLQLAISELLFRSSPESEGDLTKRRQKLVNGSSVGELGAAIGLDALVRRTRGFEPRGRSRLAADATEAVLGAVFLDGGYETARGVVERLFAERLLQAGDAPAPRDLKSALNQACEQRWRSPPTYRFLASEGLPHEAVHTWEVELPDGTVFRAQGRNKREIHHSLAGVALEALEARAAP